MQKQEGGLHYISFSKRTVIDVDFSPDRPVTRQEKQDSTAEDGLVFARELVQI
jgi:hypothetical protein